MCLANYSSEVIVTFCLNTFAFLLKYVAIPSPTPGLFSQGAHALGLWCLPAEVHWDAAMRSLQYECLWLLGCLFAVDGVFNSARSACLSRMFSQPSAPRALSSLRAKVNNCFLPPLVLLCWITHKNLLLGKPILVHTLLLLQWTLLSHKVSTQAKGRTTRCGMHFTGPILCQEVKSSPSQEN